MNKLIISNKQNMLKLEWVYFIFFSLTETLLPDGIATNKSLLR